MSPEERYRIVHIAETESVGEQDILEFWKRERAMPPEVARERVREVACVGLEREEGLVAVSTAYLQRNQRLGMDLWHYRLFIAERHRRSALAEPLTRNTSEYLQERYVSGEDRRGSGIFVRVENEVLKAVKNEAVWPDREGRFDFAFIGEDPRGNHCRVHYFPGARVPVSD